MRISAKVDYAVRAAVELGRAPPDTPVKGDLIGAAQGIPVRFLENILGELRHAGIVASQRGGTGGYWLARPATEVSVADIIRAVEGPLADVRGVRPEALDDAEPTVQQMWIAVRANLRSVLETVSVAALAAGDLPPDVAAIAADPTAWKPH